MHDSMAHRPRKRFGQNFLHDPLTIERILAAIAPRAGDHLVEIGPGEGALTAGLLRAAGELDAIELDRDLVEPLRQRLGGIGQLRIHQNDALAVDFTALAAAVDTPGARLRIVGNLPYNISTPLLFHLLDHADCIVDLHLMLQKEVGERISAEPGNKAYGRLSVMVQTRCAASRLLHVGPGAFRPAPKVDSVVLRLRPLDPPPHSLADHALHARLVAAAFGQRRKTLRNSLRGLLDEAGFTRAGIDPGARAETVDIAGFARLANAAADLTCEPTQGDNAHDGS